MWSTTGGSRNQRWGRQIGTALNVLVMVTAAAEVGVLLFHSYPCPRLTMNVENVLTFGAAYLR